MSSVFSSGLSEYHTIVSEVTRPDGAYSVALVLDQDPDFPELWIFDRSKAMIVKLEARESERSYGIINWPGEMLFWDKNDFVVRAFDRLNGFTDFQLLLEEKMFDWMGERVRDRAEIQSEEWWVHVRKKGVARWLRSRVFTDKSAQLFYSYDSGGRCDYYISSENLKSKIGREYELSGPDNKNLLSNKLIPPIGETDEDIAVKLEEVEPPSVLYYDGKKKKRFEWVEYQGLRNLNPKLVHLSQEKEEATSAVILDDTPILLKVKSALMHEEGFKFYLSAEGEWLTEFVPAEYIETENV